MRRTPVISAAVVAALAAGGILAVSGGAQAPGGQTINLVTKNFRFKANDLPPRERNRQSTGRGDSFVIEALVTDSAGVRQGNFDAICTATRGGRSGRAVCNGAYTLREGSLYLTTVFRNTDEGNVSGAIVGGTRTYAGARGTFTTKDRPGEKGGDPSDDVVTLLP